MIKLQCSVDELLAGFIPVFVPDADHLDQPEKSAIGRQICEALSLLPWFYRTPVLIWLILFQWLGWACKQNRFYRLTLPQKHRVIKVIRRLLPGWESVSRLLATLTYFSYYDHIAQSED